MRKIGTAVMIAVFCGAALAQGDFQKGLSYYQQGQYPRAIQEFEQIVKANPEYEDGFRILGDSYLQTRQYAKAVEAFQSALRLKNDKFVSYYGLALALFNLGRYSETASTLARAERLAVSPGDQARLYRLRGSAYFNQKEYGRAVSDLKRAMGIQRGGETELLQLAISHFQLREFSEAEQVFRQVLAINPNAAEARRYLSRMNYSRALDAIEQRRYQEAIPILREYLAQNENDGEAWFNLGLAYLFGDNLSEAEKAFVRTTELVPDNGEAHDRLGFIYEKNGQYQKALQSYRKALGLNDTSRIRESIERVNERIRRQRSETRFVRSRA